MNAGHDNAVWRLLDQLQMNQRQQAAQLVELRSLIASLELPGRADPVRCPDCGSRFTRLSTMQTHRYHHHNGPLPDSWAAADALVEEVEA